MKRLKRILYWLAIAFIVISLYSYIFAPNIPIQFRDADLSNYYHGILLFAFPIAILLTLFGTLKTEYNHFKILIIITITSLISIIIFTLSLKFVFLPGYGHWVDLTVLYRSKKESNIKIANQLYDVGAFGYRGKRTVKIKPFLYLYETAQDIDTTKIDKSQWDYINEEGDFKFP